MSANKMFRARLILFFLLLSFSGFAQLTANFSATPTSGCAPLIVRFTDQTSGNPTSWQWDLGNGTISYLRNPSVTYFEPGQYTVKLVARTWNNVDSVVKVEYITVYAKPVIDFSVTRTTGCYPLDVQFTDLTTTGNGSLTSWQWDFGDGNTSTQQNPAHVYTRSGNFNVSLQARNTFGCVAAISKSSYIQISTGVLADFTIANNTSCSAPATVQFNNTSTGVGTRTYLWDFGDGTTSTQTSPAHVYQQGGTYPVRLIVYNNSGCSDTITKPDAVVLGTVDAAFTAPDTVCAGSTASFTNTSTPNPVTAVWYFGDGDSSLTINATHKYNLPGTYTVKLISGFGACSDSFFKQIVVRPRPVVAFTTADTTSCKTPLQVNFTNASVAGTYSWSFGNNTSSTDANPSVMYNNYGSFAVKLVVTDQFGCSDSLFKPNYIRIIQPAIAFYSLPDSGCVPFTKRFNAVVTSNRPITTYNWNLGDGTTSNLQNPQHTYNSIGIYPVSLIVTTAEGCADTLTIQRGVVVGDKPNLLYNIVPTNTCASEAVSFRDSTIGATAWKWEFGDGSVVRSQNATHQYQDTGYFDIKLTVWSNGCADSVTLIKHVYIKAPIARFRVDADCASPLSRSFVNTSIGADDLLWDFGDGNTSTVFSPVHTYSAPGIYSVSLYVHNATTGCEQTQFKQITVVNPKANFFATDTVPCKGVAVRFNTGLSASDVSSFSWNFGDGTPVVATTTPYTYHTYNQTGTFTVRLIIRSIQGCLDTLTKTSYIRVDGPKASFSISSGNGCLNKLVTFADSTLGDGINPIQSWTWNYGDGITQTLNAGPFSHTYDSTGQYTVSLLVTDTKGCRDSFQLASPILISKPTASWVNYDTLTCPGKTVRFFADGPRTGWSYSWDFGDGRTAPHQFNQITYPVDGVYTVKLVVTDQFGCKDSLIRPDNVKVISPVSRFTMSDSVAFCPPLLVIFTDSSVDAVSRIWDFGDSTSTTMANPGHFYVNPGIYTIRLTVTGPGGCSTFSEQHVTVKGPSGTFNYQPRSGCNPLSVSFVGHSREEAYFIWDFSDGNLENSIDSTISHTFSHPGTYVPKMILMDSYGCKVPIAGTDTIVVKGVDASFGSDNHAICDSGIIRFSDSSRAYQDVITGYLWTFGDGTTSTLASPAHTYTTPGRYFPKLQVTTAGGCTDTLTLSNPVRVVASPRINMLSTANGCTPLRVQFAGQLTVPDTSAIQWQWNFGNGSASAVALPAIQTFSNAGVYNVALTATNSTGCFTTVTRDVEAYEVPVVQAGADQILCYGNTLTLQASGALNYSWSPAADLSCTTCPNPVTNTTRNKQYIVTGTTIHGCSAKDTVNVNVKNSFTMRVGNGATTCKGTAKQISASGAHSYEWTPTTGLRNGTDSVQQAVPDVTTTYRVVGTDDVGCFKDTGYVTIVVHPIPVVEAGIDKTINVGQSVDLVPTISSDVTNVNWFPNDGLTRVTYPGITVRPTRNTEYTVEAVNAGGCLSRDKVSVFVICNGGNVFIPNTFSPDGNGVNDIFYPRGTGLYRIKNMKIFNRWGELMFERNSFLANDANAGWDGTFKGQKLNADVFVYTIDIICDNNAVLTYTGNVALVR